MNSKHPFKTLKAAQQWIESVEKFGEKYDLIRMQNACEMLGNPQNGFKSIHIGGTNGKGSTVQYLNQILLKSGYNVGTFTSPYIVHFNERITFNDTMISDDALRHYINVVYHLQEDYKNIHNDQITFFELITLISFLYFEAIDVDVVLYEVGLGGLLDATNVITPMISVITSIGYDHMGVLGNTLESIAHNKLGIVKPDIPLVTGVEQETLRPMFKSFTQQTNSPLHFADISEVKAITTGFPTSFIYQDTQYSLNMPGMHQIKNALVALKTCAVLNNTYDFSIENDDQVNGLKKAIMPGRFESIKGVILDGAHNITGLEASLKTLETYYPDQPKTIVFNVMKDKDYQPMLDLIDNYATRVIFTQIPTPRSESAKTLHEKSSSKNKIFIEDYKKIYQHLFVPNTVTLITGSLYFISMIRNEIINQ